MSQRLLSENDKIKMARDVANYLLGDPDNHIEPLSISHIMRLKNLRLQLQRACNKIKLYSVR